ncbi:MAG: hypothetical protein R3F33_07185 [Planctomycetota bacterium]
MLALACPALAQVTPAPTAPEAPASADAEEAALQAALRDQLTRIEAQVGVIEVEGPLAGSVIRQVTGVALDNQTVVTSALGLSGGRMPGLFPAASASPCKSWTWT